MVKKIGLFLILLAVLTGCRKPLSHPEVVDPVYRDLRAEEAKAFSVYKEKDRAAAEAKKVYEQAPIRTGQRLSGQEEYFNILKEKERAAENYRYLAIKAELRKKADARSYPDFYTNKKPWPDQEQYRDYEVEKRLANAPKTWDPDARIKERSLANVPKQKDEAHE